MKKLLFINLVGVILLLSSCDYLRTQFPQDTIEQTLKTGLVPINGYFWNDVDYFRHQHRDEILKTLKVEEKIEVKGSDLCLVLFSYSVASQIKKRAQWFRKVDGKWTFCATYFSQYDDDPLGNGDKESAKKLLEKADKWEESSKEIWW
ncbi:hypothetical protein [Prolixibacter denitrificans]|jgi:hypothetical protein|uniref:Lipoprotein n=1 Tax=Prolixibacter denitrificans TaxID=1541063 RepID=A0A2P8CFJ8_9BACT|nr:hypothetical protein [Prolixibacter denitrificans]PSK83734.1 hypothetical protein CLV93_103149 [Prolixibacter denitrificans]GET23278.1 hypothetical protein JCM18694_35240 [Prolixibacter denitrificans]